MNSDYSSFQNRHAEFAARMRSRVRPPEQIIVSAAEPHNNNEGQEDSDAYTRELKKLIADLSSLLD